MNLQEMRQRKADALSSARAIHNKAVAEDRDFTADEQTEYNKHKATATRLDGQIKAEEELVEHERSLGAAAHHDVASQGGVVSEAKVKASVKGRSIEVNDPKGFRSFGEQLLAVRTAALSGGHKTDPRLTAGPSGLNESTPSEGGFLVQTDFSAELLSNSWDVGQVSSRVQHYPISANANSMKINAVDERSRQNGSRTGGIMAYWANEAANLTATKPKFRQLQLTLNKLTALVYVTDEELQDAAFLSTMIAAKFPEELNFRIEDAILNGLGDGQPLGIQQSQSLIVVPKDTNQPTGTLSYNNVLNMYSRQVASSRANSVWLINQSIEPQLFALSQQGTAGGIFPVYLPPGGISGSPYGTLFGRPVIPVEQTSALGTQGDINLFDLKQYIMIDKGDIQTAQSMHVRFLEDEMVFRFTYRADGQPEWNFPVQPFAKNAPTVSPFVTLASRP